MAGAQNQLKMPTRRPQPGFLARLLGTKTKFQTQRALWGYVFALPWILGLVIIWHGTILNSFY